jgi:hypothetical protein
MLATTTMKAASIRDLARNKLRNIHATSAEKRLQHPTLKNSEGVAPFTLDEQGILRPRMKPAQPIRPVIFCRDCASYVATASIWRAHGEPMEVPGGCTIGLTTPDAWPPIYPFTGWHCSGCTQ